MMEPSPWGGRCTLNDFGHKSASWAAKTWTQSRAQGLTGGRALLMGVREMVSEAGPRVGPESGDELPQDCIPAAGMDHGEVGRARNDRVLVGLDPSGQWGHQRAGHTTFSLGRPRREGVHFTAHTRACETPFSDPLRRSFTRADCVGPGDPQCDQRGRI